VKALHAWLEGAYVGIFVEHPDGLVQFNYADDAPAPPVSLSLPRGGRWAERTPKRFLDNLLPDTNRARRRMATAVGAASASIFDLLAKVGGDIAGGLVLSPSDAPPAPAKSGDLQKLDIDDIAFRIHELRNDPDSWWDRQIEQFRFSLAGTQPKFALARVENAWFAPNKAVPSTHIIKPASTHAFNSDLVETATARLARLAGLPAMRSGLLQALDQRAFAIERFDRDVTTTPAKRLHTEDLAQAMGLMPDQKYGPTAKQVINLLLAADATEQTAYQFIEQLAFNVAVGNADAHVKNYSVFLRPASISMTPIYDALSTSFWEYMDNRLAMKISGADRAAAITPSHWAKQARQSGLDPDRVVDIAERVSRQVLDQADEAFAELPDSIRTRLAQTVARANRGMARQTQPTQPPITSFPSIEVSPTESYEDPSP
jgi:serine/threonine-protein kinase HipA